MWKDFKFANRQLLRHPVSNLVIVVTIALLLGAVSTIYASIRAQAQKMMPFPEAHQLVKIWRQAEKRTTSEYPYGFYQAFKDDLDSFELLGALERRRSMTMTGNGEPHTFSTSRATASILSMTKMPPLVGRLFNESDESPGNDRIVLLAHRAWKERFNEDDDVIGRIVRLDGAEHEIVGVLNPLLDHTHLGYIDLWLPLTKPTEEKRPFIEVSVIGRIKAEKRISEAAAEVQALATFLEAEHTPSDYERRIFPNGFQASQLAILSKSLARQEQSMNPEAIGIMVFTGGIMTCVILIACFNVTNLLLIRSTSRGREIAIRLSIGASRFRIVRQLLSESILLSLIGSGLGLTVSQALWAYFRRQQFDASFDLGLFAVAALTALVLGALVGLVPSLQSSRADFNRELKDGSHASQGKRRHRLRHLLVGGQVAMAIVLCVGSTVTTRSYLKINQTELGFEPKNMMIVSARPQRKNYPKSEDAIRYANQGLQLLQEEPGIDEVAASFSGILTYFSFREEIRIQDGTNEETAVSGSWYTTANLPEMVGINVVHGRGLLPDTEPLQAEILINEMFVSEFLGDKEPLGLTIHIKSLNQWMTVVGVVRDRSPLTSFQEPLPEFYASYRHSYSVSEISFLVRTRGDVKQAGAPIRETIKRIDRNQPISQIKFVPDLMEQRLAGPKSAMIFLTLIASFGMLIAVLGIYGVVSFTVAERTREVGIRMALGAEKRSILRLLMAQGIRLLIFGGLPGLMIAFAVTQGLPKRLLYKLTPWDPTTYLIVIALVSVSGLLACLIPAKKATRLNPMTALRYE